jgi:hypothetical protein
VLALLGIHDLNELLDRLIESLCPTMEARPGRGLCGVDAQCPTHGGMSRKKTIEAANISHGVYDLLIGLRF